MYHSAKIPVISKVITIKRDGIEIRYRKKEFYMPFSDIHDIKLIKSKMTQNIIILNMLIISLLTTPILFFNFLDNSAFMMLYFFMLLLVINFKSKRYEQAYFIAVILIDGKCYKIKIQHKDRLDVIREITGYIDYRFKRSMQELFTELENSIESTAS